MTKTLTPEQSRLLTALHKAPLPVPWSCQDAVHLVAGKGAQVHEELAAALAGYLGKAVSKFKLGKNLVDMVDIEDEETFLILQRNFKKGVNHYKYRTFDLAEHPVPLLGRSDAEVKREAHWLSLPPSKFLAAFAAETNRNARATRDNFKYEREQEEKELNAKLRADERAQLKAAAEADENCAQVWGRVTYRNKDDALRVLDSIKFGGKVIDQSSNSFALRWLLPADMVQAHQDLLVLKGLAREHDIALNLDTVPVEVLLGKTLGSHASRDARDYEDYSVRRATQLAFAGDMTTPIDAARRARRNWNPFDPI